MVNRITESLRMVMDGYIVVILMIMFIRKPIRDLWRQPGQSKLHYYNSWLDSNHTSTASVRRFAMIRPVRALREFDFS